MHLITSLLMFLRFDYFSINEFHCLVHIIHIIINEVYYNMNYYCLKNFTIVKLNYH